MQTIKLTLTFAIMAQIFRSDFFKSKPDLKSLSEDYQLSKLLPYQQFTPFSMWETLLPVQIVVS